MGLFSSVDIRNEPQFNVYMKIIEALRANALKFADTRKH